MRLPATVLLAGLVAGPILCAGGVASAKSLTLPEDKPAMSAALPDNWKPTDTERGMEATSPKGEVYASVEYASDDRGDLAALMEANGAWMTKNKIVPVGATTRDRTLTVNGMTAHEITYNARDKDGPTSVTYVLVPLPKQGVGVVTVWGSEKQRAPQAKAIASIIDSIKPLE